METEAKLGFKSKDDLYGLISADFFRKFCINETEPEPVMLENTYLDTKDMDISGRGGMIRLRHYKGADSDNYEVTVKYGGGVSGSISYKEDSLAMLTEALGNIKDDDLSVLCSNSFNRTVYDLVYGRSHIEACFDSGIISNPDGSKTDEICELELELINGNLEDLTGLADLVIEKTGCVPFGETKPLSLRNGECLCIIAIIADADMHGMDLFHDGVLFECAVKCYMRSASLIIEDLDLIEPSAFRICPKGFEYSFLGCKTTAKVISRDRSFLCLIQFLPGECFFPKRIAGL